MAKYVTPNCENCTQKEGNCCKGCFKGDKENIFNYLTDKELDFLIKHKKQILYEPREVIIGQNDQQNFGLCFKSGIAKINVEIEKDKNFIIKLITRREFLCGGHVFGDEASQFAISALTPVTCCIIESNAFKKLFDTNKNFANQLIKHKSLQQKYYLDRMMHISQKYMPGRIANTLLYLKNEVFNSNPFTVPMYRKELADLSNLALASFVRGLKDFEESGIIKVKGNEIQIIKEDILISINSKG